MNRRLVLACSEIDEFNFVVPGLVPGIHALIFRPAKTRMAGS
jgi:hypothetical protein